MKKGAKKSAAVVPGDDRAILRARTSTPHSSANSSCVRFCSRRSARTLAPMVIRASLRGRGSTQRKYLRRSRQNTIHSSCFR